MSTQRARIALVLSGGGSRGAYEAGVVLFLRERLSRRLGRQVSFDIITGTSVGAINGTFLAATSEDPSSQSQRLVHAWRSLHLEELMSLGTLDLFRAMRLLVANDLPPPAPGSFRYGGLLDTSGLERFVIRTIPWRNIRRNLQQRHIQALAVSATHIGTGHTMVFTCTADERHLEWSRNPFIRQRPALIGPRHVLASAAIPILFPAVRVDGEFYTDGGLRLNTPLSPAIRLGADKILVISLRYVPSQAEDTNLVQMHNREADFPRPLFLVGKALNALLLDHTNYDIDRMERLNAVLEAGQECFGPQFLDILNRKLEELRGAPIRRINAMHIRPSADIGVLATEFVAKGRTSIRARMARRLVQRLAERESKHENDLVSYLLFDGGFAAELIDLGYRDAAHKEDELVRFFTED